MEMQEEMKIFYLLSFILGGILMKENNE